MALVVTRQAIDCIFAEAAASHPLECCGLLLGKGDRIGEVRPAANIHPDPKRFFEIDPQTLIDAHRNARSGGPLLIGYYHSHPLGPPEPSATDRAHGTGDEESKDNQESEENVAEKFEVADQRWREDDQGKE